MRLQERKQKDDVQFEEATGKRVRVFLQSAFYLLDGDWQWEMETEAVFCSDVMFSLSEDFIGTKAIFHPDDVPVVKEKLSTEQIIPSLSFRIITTYGEVKTVTGENIVAVEEVLHNWQEQALQTVVQNREKKAEHRHLHLLREIDEKTSRFSGVGQWYYNAVTHEAWYADFVYQLHGLAPQSLNAHLHTFLPFVHPEDKGFVTEYTDKAFRDRSPLHMDYRIEVAGTEKWVSYKAQWFYSEKGEAVLGGIFQDITEQRIAERETEGYKNLVQFQRQQALYDEQQVNIGHWQINLLTRKTTYSDQYYRIFGLKPQSLAPTISAFLNYVHPDDREKVEAAYKQIIYEHAVPDIEYRIVRHDGKTRYVLQKGKLVTVEQELNVSGIIQDITVQRMLEKKVAEQADALQLRQYLSQLGDEQANLFSWVMDLEENTVAWSDSFYKLTGHSKLQPTNITEKTLLSQVHPQDVNAFRKHWNLAVAEMQPASFDVRFLLRGVVQYMKAVFHFYQLAGKNYFIGILQNTTAEQVLQQQLSQRVQLAESLSENTLDRVIITDANNTILLWNRSCEQAYGIRKVEAIGENFFDLFPQLKTEAEMQVFQRVLRGEKVTQEEVSTSLGRGYFDLHLTPLYTDEDVSGILHIIHDVTREVELRNSLHDRLQLIEGLVQSAVDRIVVLDRNMNYVYWNQQAEAHYGLAKEKVIGRNILEVFPGFQNDPGYGMFRKVLRGETVHIPATLTEKSTEYIETYLTPIKDENDEVTAVLWVVHDRSGEYALMQTQKKAVDVLNNVNAVFIELDNEYRFRFLNTTAEHYLGKRSEELLGQVMWAVFPHAVGTPGYNAIVKSVTEKTGAETEYFSAIFQKWMYQSVIPTEDGALIFFYDRQDIKEAEQKTAESHRLLVASEMVAHTGSYEADLQTMTFRFSEGVYRLFGEEPYSVELTLEFIDARSFAEDIAPVRAILEQAMLEKKPYHYIRRIYRKDGELRTLEIHGNVVCDAEGKALKFLGLVQDITERKTAEHQLAKQSHYLRRIMETVPDMVSIMDLPTRQLRYLNKETFAIHGFDPNEMTNRSPQQLAELIHPDDRETLNAYFSGFNTASDDEILTAEYRALDNTGEWKWFHVRGKAFQRNKEGKVTQVLNAIENITERKKAVQQLQKAKDLFRAVFDISLQAVILFKAVRSAEGEIVDYEVVLNNAMTQQWNGRSLVGKRYGEEFPHIRKFGIFDMYKDVLETGEPKKIEVHYEGEGLQNWFTISAVKLSDDELVATAEDITEQKLAVNEVKKNLTILQHTEEMAQTGSWEYEIATGKFSWSEGMYRLFGLPQSSHVSPETYLNFSAETDRAIAKQIVKNLKRTHQPFEETLQIKRYGDVRLLKIKGLVVNDEAGKPKRMVGVDLDITDIKDAEAKIKESRRWLEQTALASPDAINVYSLQTKQPVYLNDCLAKWLGVSSEELLNMGINGRLELVHPDDRLKLLHFNEMLKASGDGAVLTLDYRLRTKKGMLLWIRNRSKVFQRDAHGTVTHLLSFLQDVTEEKAAEEVLKGLNASLEKKNQELEQKNDEITSFAFVASHDLKEPLRKIHTFSDWLLTKEDSLSKEGKLHLQRVSAAVKRLDLLIDDILALTKVHVGNEQLKLVDLNALLQQVKEEMHEKLEKTDAVIEVAALPTIAGVENQLFYLFKNLIGNAVKFQPGENRPVIRIGAGKEGAFVKIEVADNGLGIAKEYHKKIFEMFRRLHGREEFDGTGMGLAICKKIMEKHGGKITVESEEGQGAVFVCWFPAALSTTPER